MPDFTKHLSDACTYAQAGFHFEEGGCFGMAAALYEAFVDDGYVPKIMAMDSICHMLVEVNGTLYDHQGIVRSTPKVHEVRADALAVHAVANGRSVDEFEADRNWARDIIAQARVLTACHDRIIESAVDNFGFDEREASSFVDMLRETDIAQAIATSLAGDSTFEIAGCRPSHGVLALVTDGQAALLGKIFENASAVLCLETMVRRTLKSTFWDAVAEPTGQFSPG